MPRRNRNASLPLVTPDMLADQIAQIASDLLTRQDRAPLCAACLSTRPPRAITAPRARARSPLPLPTSLRRR